MSNMFYFDISSTFNDFKFFSVCRCNDIDPKIFGHWVYKPTGEFDAKPAVSAYAFYVAEV